MADLADTMMHPEHTFDLPTSSWADEEVFQISHVDEADKEAGHNKPRELGFILAVIVQALRDFDLIPDRTKN